MQATDSGRTLLESIQLLTDWFGRDDFPGWMPIEAMLRPRDSSVPYSSEQDLALIRDESRFYAQSHPFAISAIENRISYVVGSGHNYKVRARPNVSVDAGTLEKIEAEILDFQERNQWFLRQQEIQRRMDRDGEVFLRFFDAGGKLFIRFIEPEAIAQPAGRSNAEYGIEADPDDVETVTGYWMRRGPIGRPEQLMASQVQHRKANVDATAPRGVPLLYSIRSNLRRSWKLLRNMSTVASVQAAIAIVRRHSGGKAGSIQQYVNNVATAQIRDESGNTKDYQQYPPGAIVDLPPGVEYDFPSQGINVANYVDALQAELRAIAARLCMPEYMLSGDASNANYASTMVAEGPSVKIFERLQSGMIWHDYQVIQRALATAERAGRLPEGVLDMVEIDADAPMVMTRDRLREAQADQILLSQGIVSQQTVAARHGYDYDQERDLMDQEAERDGGIATADNQ